MKRWLRLFHQQSDANPAGDSSSGGIFERQRHQMISDEQLETLQADLLEESKLSLNYIFLSIGSAGMATIGLVANSATVIIGAMIVAPLMMPMRGFALGCLLGNRSLVITALKAIVVGTLIGVGVAFLLSWPTRIPEFQSEILARTRPTILDLLVAVLAGAVAAFARIRPKIADSLAGIAIAVALMPPLCVVGIGLAEQDWQISRGAWAMYMTNWVGITLACLITFLIMGYAPHRRRRLISRATLSSVLALVLAIFLGFKPLYRRRVYSIWQSILERNVQAALLEGTITFQRVELLRSEFDWEVDPPEVRFVVLADEPITSKQVNLIEDFVEQQTGHSFTFKFRVVSFQSVEHSVKKIDRQKIPSFEKSN